MTAPWDGRPQEPEVTAWDGKPLAEGGQWNDHILMRRKDRSLVEMRHFAAPRSYWLKRNGIHATEPEISSQFSYVCPVLTPADLAARDAATIERCAVACEGERDDFKANSCIAEALGANFAAKAVRALKTQEAK